MTGTEQDRLNAAADAYHAATFNGDASGIDAAERGLDALDAQVALARGRLRHLRATAAGVDDPEELALFQRAEAGFQALGDTAGEAEAAFWVGCYHQVIRHDDDTAMPSLQRSADLAHHARAGVIRSYALRHLGIHAHRKGRLDDAQAMLEESTSLRRDAGFDAGVAANLVGLAYIAIEDGRPFDAVDFLDEADTLSAGSGADAVTAQAAEARTRL